MGTSHRRRGAPIEGINTTPLVDVVLVLLVVFMVTAPMLEHHGIPLDLPSGASGESVVQVFAVTIDASGRRLVDGSAVDEPGLGRAARRALTRDPELRAVIEADGDVAYRRVVDTIDTLRVAGISKIAFSTRAESGSNDASH